MSDHESPELRDYLRAKRNHYDRDTAGLAGLRDRLRAEARSRLPGVGPNGVGWESAGFAYAWRDVPGRDYRQLVRHRAGDPGGAETVLDENELAGAGGHLRLGVCQVSPDGRLLAYSTDVTGEELYTLRIKEIATGRTVLAAVERTFDSCAWSAASDQLFYVVADDSHRPYRVRRHAVGTAPAGDVDVFVEDDRRFVVRLRSTDSGRWIVITSTSAETSEERLLAADEPCVPARVVEPRRTGRMYTVEHSAGDDHFVITTNDGAGEFRVVGAPVSEPGRTRWAQLVDESPDVRVHSARRHGGLLVLTGIREATPLVRVYGADGRLHGEIVPDDPAGHLTLEPAASDAGGLGIATSSLCTPRRTSRVSLTDFRRTQVVDEVWPAYDPATFVTARTWGVADDGTEIPVTVVRRADVRPDGSNPCVISAYGAYERSMPLEPRPTLPGLLERGVVYAVAHVRGGGERGRRWWQDGRLSAKWNTFTDLIAVRDHLAGTGWADERRIACRGLSAGGMLMAGAYTFWPERFAAVVAEVPAADCLNTMLDPGNPLVVNEYDEWGDPREPAAFLDIQRYTAYEHVADRPRPPLLVTGILRDPRVVVEEPAKWVAALRAVDTHGNRVLFRAELGDMPHAGPAGRLSRLDYEAEIWAFVLDALGVRE